MRIPFYKYQATANDFVIINQMVVPYLQEPSIDLISGICDRRLGVGADGLMIIAPSLIADFKMIYYNSDGRLSSMCGNGGRAIAHLAHDLKLCKSECTFEAVDGIHEVVILGDEIRLKMIDVLEYQKKGAAYIIDTGSPHYISRVRNVEEIDLISEAHKIRYNDNYKTDGININFYHKNENHIVVRTYERGVEDETYSCGTGVTAVAIAEVLEQRGGNGDHAVKVMTKGGLLTVNFRRSSDFFTDVWLSGPAIKAFDGSIAV